MSDKNALTESESRILAAAWQCFKGAAPDIDYDKLAKHAGHSNPKSTFNAFTKIKKKLAIIAGQSPNDNGDDNDKDDGKGTSAPATPKSARPQRNGAVSAAKRKLTTKDGDASSPEDENDNVTAGRATTTKARGRGKAVTIKPKAATGPAAKKPKIKAEDTTSETEEPIEAAVTKSKTTAAGTATVKPEVKVEDTSSDEEQAGETVIAPAAAKKTTATVLKADKNFPCFPNLGKNKKDGVEAGAAGAGAGLTVTVPTANRNDARGRRAMDRAASRERSVSQASDATGASKKGLKRGGVAAAKVKVETIKEEEGEEGGQGGEKDGDATEVEDEDVV